MNTCALARCLLEGEVSTEFEVAVEDMEETPENCKLGVEAIAKMTSPPKAAQMQKCHVQRFLLKPKRCENP